MSRKSTIEAIAEAAKPHGIVAPYLTVIDDPTPLFNVRCSHPRCRHPAKVRVVAMGWSGVLRHVRRDGADAELVGVRAVCGIHRFRNEEAAKRGVQNDEARARDEARRGRVNRAINVVLMLNRALQVKHNISVSFQVGHSGDNLIMTVEAAEELLAALGGPQ